LWINNVGWTNGYLVEYGFRKTLQTCTSRPLSTTDLRQARDDNEGRLFSATADSLTQTRASLSVTALSHVNTDAFF
ncbi:hypothetical protein T4E_12031, partial [Trichinella pseudospiralis]